MRRHAKMVASSDHDKKEFALDVIHEQTTHPLDLFTNDAFSIVLNFLNFSDAMKLKHLSNYFNNKIKADFP